MVPLAITSFHFLQISCFMPSPGLPYPVYWGGWVYVMIHTSNRYPIPIVILHPPPIHVHSTTRSTLDIQPPLGCRRPAPTANKLTSCFSTQRCSVSIKIITYTSPFYADWKHKVFTNVQIVLSPQRNFCWIFFFVFCFLQHGHEYTCTMHIAHAYWVHR